MKRPLVRTLMLIALLASACGESGSESDPVATDEANRTPVLTLRAEVPARGVGLIEGDGRVDTAAYHLTRQTHGPGLAQGRDL